MEMEADSVILVFKTGGSKAFLGYVVSSFSLGQFIAAPIFGFLSNRLGAKPST